MQFLMFCFRLILNQKFVWGVLLRKMYFEEISLRKLNLKNVHLGKYTFGEMFIICNYP